MKNSIPQLDLSTKPSGIDSKYDYLYEQSIVDNSANYLGHPDAVLLKSGNILALYPKGHGKGAVLSKISKDGGKTYTSKLKNTPKSWELSRETPTVYRLEFSNGQKDKLILICANPHKWWDEKEEPKSGGFNCSISEDEGESWSEFELFHKEIYPIVAMASLTRLKENGKFTDKWMGLFHDREFHNYKTILSFDENGKMQWSEPEMYFSKYRELEKMTSMCEVECIRSDGGLGDELCIITRSDARNINSMLSYSNDEGKTWSKPVFAPDSLTGERHKADYTPDGRLIITFRDMNHDKNLIAKYKDKYKTSDNWISEGWIAWVGTYDDLKNGTDGEYRIKLAHTYLPKQTEPEIIANSDCGYCGNVVLKDGTYVTMTYGIFKADEERKTYVVSKRLKLSDTDRLVKMLCK